ncbi:TetR family transcriptional regulator [Arthrobacter castelli]|uniref:TetR family transcriptional regulator n=1 Tax=Arthrobacter castelli TaxID=271431 RepID=UPI0003F51D9F|nr:TetR family transcriptional regulator [Arthrobacter castelli]
MSKSRRTRATIQSAALDLFLEEGYNATTVERISVAAGVSHMTFFRYFRSKDGVLLDDPYDPAIGAAVEEQPGEMVPLERACRGILSAWSDVAEEDLGDVRKRMSIAVGHPQLRARMWENNLATQHVIAEALRTTGVARLEAEVAAGACMGALLVALIDWATAGEGGIGERIQLAMSQLIPDSDVSGRVTRGIAQELP